MLFTRVVFSTCEFSQESLAIAKLALSFFMPKNGVVLNTVILKVVIFKVVTLKELFFTSPQLKITLFKPVLVQLSLMHFVDTILGSLSNKKSQLIKRETNVSTC